MQPSKMEGRGCSGTPAASTYGPGNSAIDDSELFFTVVFTIEMLVKMIASGVFFEREAYLKDGWNVMDFVVVVVSLVSLVPGMGSNVSALRVIRVLRPLRTLSVLPGMRTLIGTMIRSIPMIGNVLLFCIFSSSSSASSDFRCSKARCVIDASPWLRGRRAPTTSLTRMQ